VLDALPGTRDDLAERADVSPSSVKDLIQTVREAGYQIECTGHPHYRYHRGDGTADGFECTDFEPADVADAVEELADGDTDDAGDAPSLPDLSDTPVAETEPDPSDLSDRQRYIAGQLQQGATLPELADDLGEPERVVTARLRDLRDSGWQVYVDESSRSVAIEGDDHTLRSSEHTGTRTRKANRWWERRHNQLVREYRGLEPPTATLDADAGEDWVTHLTDLHAGDRVRRDDGSVVYSTEEIPAVIDYVTRQSLGLADRHGADYDTAHLLWGGDFVTNEGIYEGQFEDLDAWLDEQHDTLVDPLLRQLKAFADRFGTVQVVCMVGNHGEHRANGTSRQANADLILYKHVRNTVAHLREHGDVLDNVQFLIGQAEAYRNFPLRGGRLRGHLRHGQHRRPQAETSARRKEWLGTLLDHEFDVAAMGHHHVSGRIPWDGPPVICSASPKPAGEFVERLGGRTPSEHQDVATVFGVSDEGLTTVFPLDTRNYSPDR
jgi:biotin operon repressor